MSLKFGFALPTLLMVTSLILAACGEGDSGIVSALPATEPNSAILVSTPEGSDLDDSAETTQLASASDRPDPSQRPDREQLRQQVIEELGLTSDQQAAMEQLRTETEAEIRAVLTPEQVEILDTLLAESDQPPRPRDLHQQLNVTEEQRTQIREIRMNSREAFRNILTADQLAQMEELQAQRPPHSPGRPADLDE